MGDSKTGGMQVPLDQDQLEALRVYREYKRLQAMIGMPTRAFNDVEGILKDLQGEDIHSVEKDIELARTTKRNNPTPQSIYSNIG